MIGPRIALPLPAWKTSGSPAKISLACSGRVNSTSGRPRGDHPHGEDVAVLPVRPGHEPVPEAEQARRSAPGPATSGRAAGSVVSTGGGASPAERTRIRSKRSSVSACHSVVGGASWLLPHVGYGRSFAYYEYVDVRATAVSAGSAATDAEDASCSRDRVVPRRPGRSAAAGSRPRRSGRHDVLLTAHVEHRLGVDARPRAGESSRSAPFPGLAELAGAARSPLPGPASGSPDRPRRWSRSSSPARCATATATAVSGSSRP